MSFDVNTMSESYIFFFIRKLENKEKTKGK